MKGAPYLRVTHAELRDANAFVAKWHRHHKPVVGHRYSLAAIDPTGLWHGVAIVGRPVSRMCDAMNVLEVLRLASDDTPNVCSFLYAAAARAGRSLGYSKIQTYILDSESGTSLRAAGWTVAGVVQGRSWKRSEGYARRNDQPTCDKVRWELELGS